MAIPHQSRAGDVCLALWLQLEGSRSVRAVNDKFAATMTNQVRWRDAESSLQQDPSSSSSSRVTSGGVSVPSSKADPNPNSGRLRQITSDTSIQVNIICGNCS